MHSVNEPLDPPMMTHVLNSFRYLLLSFLQVTSSSRRDTGKGKILDKQIIAKYNGNLTI